MRAESHDPTPSISPHHNQLGGCAARSAHITLSFHSIKRLVWLYNQSKTDLFCLLLITWAIIRGRRMIGLFLMLLPLLFWDECYILIKYGRSEERNCPGPHQIPRDRRLSGTITHYSSALGGDCWSRNK